MADKEYGIVLSAKDNASAAVKKLSGAMGATTKAVQTMGSTGTRAFAALGGAIVVANQGVELFKTGFNAISGLVNDSMDAVRELRGETNPLVMEMDRLATNSLAVKAALGTAFASALLGISKAFESIGGGAADFLDKNRKLIATKIVQFLFRLAQALTIGIAKALSVANDVWAEYNTLSDRALLAITGLIKAFFTLRKWMAIGNEENARWALGLKLIEEQEGRVEARVLAVVDAHQKYQDEIDTLKKDLLALAAKGYGPALKAAELFAEQAGGTPMESAAHAIMRIRNQLAGLIPTLSRAVGLFTQGLGTEGGVKKLETFRAKLDSVMRRLAVAGTKSIGPLKAEMEALYAEIGRPVTIKIDLGNVPLAVEAVQLFGDTLTDALDTGVKGFESLSLEAEMSEIAAQALFDAWAQFPAMLSELAFTAADVFEALAKGTISMGEAWAVMSMTALRSVISLVRQTIMAFAVQAAAAQFAATSIIPFGQLISAGLAAASLAFVEAMLGKVPMPQGFAQGGLVTGGVAGRDSVPAMLMPGEFVLTKQQTDSLRKGNTSLVGGSNVTIQLTSQIPPTRAEMKKFVRQNILPALRDLKAQGMT